MLAQAGIDLEAPLSSGTKIDATALRISDLLNDSASSAPIKARRNGATGQFAHAAKNQPRDDSSGLFVRKTPKNPKKQHPEPKSS